tara:strand:- start:1201 stop:1656 length:456 start_codon:yes stop_codon:yes gene_type:complete
MRNLNEVIAITLEHGFTTCLASDAIEALIRAGYTVIDPEPGPSRVLNIQEKVPSEYMRQSDYREHILRRVGDHFGRMMAEEPLFDFSHRLEDIHTESIRAACAVFKASEVLTLSAEYESQKGVLSETDAIPVMRMSVKHMRVVNSGSGRGD